MCINNNNIYNLLSIETMKDIYVRECKNVSVVLPVVYNDILITQ